MEYDTNKAGHEDHCSSRPFNEKVLLIDACFNRHFRRDQNIANYCKEELRKLGNRLASELPLSTKDLAEEFGNLRTHSEQQGSEFAESPSKYGCEGVNKLPTETRGVFLNKPEKVFDGENSDVVALKLNIDAVVARLEQTNEKTVADYEQKLRNKDQDVQCMRSRMQVLEDAVKNLKRVLKLADEKLAARIKQTEERAIQLVTEIKRNEVKQTIDVNAAADLVKTIMSVSTGIERVTSTGKVDETEIPVHLTRLQQLYQPMSEKLSAKPVAARLFQDDVLSLAELEKVQCSHTPTEAAEHLIGQILSKNSDHSYSCFLTALEATDQGHIVLWLTYDDTNAIDASEGHEAAVEDTPPLSPLGARKLVPTTSTAHEDFGSLLVTGTTAAAAKTMLPKVSSSRSKSTTSAITHVTAASEDREGSVMGLTVHGDELFIARKRPEGRIEVYNATDLTFKRYIEVKRLERVCSSGGVEVRVSGEGVVYGLTSCDSNNCLYVSYWLYIAGNGVGYIARVELTGENKVVKWKIKDDDDYYVPLGLSVNSEHNLMVACSSEQLPHRLVEYTTRGELVREILLQDDVMVPWHAIQLNGNKFLVSHGFGGHSNGDDSLHRVCVVDANGRVLLSYGNKRGSKTGLLRGPKHLAVDRNGFNFVADSFNNRIVVLDSTLKWSRDLQIDGDSGVKRPYSLYLDEQRNLLFVGEWNEHDSRVVIVTV